MAGHIFRKFCGLAFLVPPVGALLSHHLLLYRTSIFRHSGLPSSLGFSIASKERNANKENLLKCTRDQNHSAWTCLASSHQVWRSMRQPLMTARFGLARGCNPLASVVFFGAYLCSGQLHASQDWTSESNQMVGVEGFGPPRLSHLLPKQTRYQATVYTPM